VQQRLGAATVSALPRARTLSSLTQLGAPAAKRTAHPLAAELASLASSRFLERISYDRLTHLPRYLKALLIRAERAALNPAKDQERLRQLAPYQDALKKLQAQPARSPGAQRQVEAFRWMVEEFKVSLLAQEVGTALPVSPKRLDQQLETLQQTG
jgi:ATP-dependent helicase HrpA